MSKIVVWTQQASDAIEAHYRNLRVKDPDAAIKAVKEILSQGDFLKDMLYAGTALSSQPAVRKWLVQFGKYGFVIH